MGEGGWLSCEPPLCVQILAASSGKELRLLVVVQENETVKLRPHFSEEAQRAVNLPLLHAAKEGNLRTVDNLLAKGQVNVNFANQHGDTALILSCWYGHKWIAARRAVCPRRTVTRSKSLHVRPKLRAPHKTKI